MAGVAETTIEDPSCAFPQQLDFEAVIWGPKQGQIHALLAFPGDSVAAALAINDREQVVGISGVCQVPSVSPAFVVHAVLLRLSWPTVIVSDSYDHLTGGGLL